MEELYRTVVKGEQCLSWQVFQAAVRECESVGVSEEGLATAVAGTAELQSLQTECSGTSRKEAEGAEVEVTLENKELWKQFNKITNEMIVTKAGRRMFPLLQVTLSGLVATASYSLLLEFRIIDSHRWRFLNGEWQATSASSASEPPEQRCVYIHPSSPQTGAQWMKEKVTFSKLKLSNKEDGKGKVKLYSLYRYQPCLHVVQLPSPLAHKQDTATDRPKRRGLSSHVFTETQFVAVTAYQNDKITQMKIKHNPYAKAFQGPQDTLHFSRTSTESMTTLTTTHFHQTLPTLTTLATPTQQSQATPTQGAVLTHNWLPQSSHYVYDSYHAPYHTHPSAQHGYYQQPPLSMSSGGGLPPQLPGGQWVVPQREGQLDQQQQQVWYSEEGPLQTFNSQVSPMYHSR